MDTFHVTKVQHRLSLYCVQHDPTETLATLVSRPRLSVARWAEGIIQHIYTKEGTHYARTHTVLAPVGSQEACDTTYIYNIYAAYRLD